MGDEQSKPNDQPVTHKMMYDDLYVIINKECQHIRAVCEKDQVLMTIQLKLAIFAKKTFKNIKYPNHCGHYEVVKTKDGIRLTHDCKQKAPHSFPSSDVFTCLQHSKETCECFRERKHAYKLQYQVERINNKTGKNAGARIINSAYAALEQIEHAFDDGSINNVSKLPKYYWSLLMTKLLIAERYLKMRKDDNATIVEHLLQLLIMYRYVMNPIGEEVLFFIAMIITNLTTVLSLTADLTRALDDMINTVRSSMAFAAAASLVNVVVNQLQSASVRTGIESIQLGALLSAGGVAAISAAETGAVATTISALAAGEMAMVSVPIIGGAAALSGGASLLLGGVFILANHWNAASQLQQVRAQVNDIADQRINEVGEEAHIIPELDGLTVEELLRRLHALESESDSDV
eukprot:188222_1